MKVLTVCWAPWHTIWMELNSHSSSALTVRFALRGKMKWMKRMKPATVLLSSYTRRCVLERENVDDCVVARTPTHQASTTFLCGTQHHTQHVSVIDNTAALISVGMKRHIIAPVAPIYDYIRVSSVFDFSNFCFSTHFPIASLRSASSLLHCTNDRYGYCLRVSSALGLRISLWLLLLSSSSSDALPPNIVLPTRCLLVLRLFSYLLMCRCCRFAIISLDGCVPTLLLFGFRFCVWMWIAKEDNGTDESNFSWNWFTSNSRGTHTKGKWNLLTSS